MKSIARLFSLLVTLFSAGLMAQDPVTGASWSITGHVKYQVNADRFPENSVFRDLLGSNNVAQSLVTRLNGAVVRDHWEYAADYQLIAIRSDSVHIADSLPGLPVAAGGVISDDRRWWNLTHTATAGDQSVVINRLDRLHVGYTSDYFVWRFGRQAISWGNGLIFTPMDVFNSFDPTAVDKEYKTGDDMLYGQRLFASGNDLQGIAIVRRNPGTGEVESGQSSLAFKYHGFLGTNEFDILVAEHYGKRLLGFGGVVSLGGAIGRGDITWTETDASPVISAVSSINYSWTWGERNFSGLLEYYYNGFGQENQNYTFDQLQHNPDLLKRLERGELFTLGRHYLAASLTVELSPLFRLTPNVFVNLQDPSALVQILAQYDWRQNLALLTALNIPVGPDGSEYGGTQAPLEGQYFSTDVSIILQLAFYF